MAAKADNIARRVNLENVSTDFIIGALHNAADKIERGGQDIRKATRGS
jgi:hypothetical protein